ncbi:hypothetical protein NQZ68_000058 [Dissostichus eleginoides]|nr:hypothetical protein NQZ68_000058 [Dissostichus eleginoides]
MVLEHNRVGLQSEPPVSLQSEPPVSHRAPERVIRPLGRLLPPEPDLLPYSQEETHSSLQPLHKMARVRESDTSEKREEMVENTRTVLAVCQQTGVQGACAWRRDTHTLRDKQAATTPRTLININRGRELVGEYRVLSG